MEMENIRGGAQRPNPRIVFADILYKGFVAPFKEARLAGLYVASLVTAFGWAFLDVFMGLDYLQKGLWQLVGFAAGKYGIIGFLMMPLFFLWTRIPVRVYGAIIMLLPVLGLGYAFWNQVEGVRSLGGFEYGLLLGTGMSTFWVLYHLIMVANTSDGNRGNEISLATTGVTVGMFFGAIGGGYVKQFDFPQEYGMIGLAAMMTGTFLIWNCAWREDIFRRMRANGALQETFRQALLKDPERTRTTFMEGAFHVAHGLLWPVFLSVQGFAALGIGFVHGMNVLLKIFISPIAGYLTNQDHGREIEFGGWIKVAGWLPWLSLSSVALIPLSSVLWALGGHLFAVGTTARWYKCRSVASVAVREGLFGVSRVMFIFIMVPALFYSPAMFILICAALTTLLTLCGRAMRTKAAVAKVTQPA